MQHTVKEDYTHPELEWVGDDKLIFITAHRRENLGEPMHNMFRAIRRVLDEHLDCKAVYPIHMNPIVRKAADEELGGCDRIHIIEPIEVFDCHNFEARCHLCLTDSGGIQEEVPSYAAGELKHGTISLIEPGTLVIGVLTQSKLYEKTMSNMVECRSRGAYLLGLTTYGKYEIEETVDFAVYVPRIDEYFAGSLAVVPLQLLGYYVSVAKGLDVDKPRNLAKSVTVE